MARGRDSDEVSGLEKERILMVNGIITHCISPLGRSICWELTITVARLNLAHKFPPKDIGDDCKERMADIGMTD